MSSADHIRCLYEAVSTKDSAVIEAFGCDEGEWFDVPFDYLVTGPRALIDLWNAWFGYLPDATNERYGVAKAGDTVIAQGIGLGAHRGAFMSPACMIEPTGRAIETRFCDVYRLRGDEIIRADSYFDFFTSCSDNSPLRRCRRRQFDCGMIWIVDNRS